MCVCVCVCVCVCGPIYLNYNVGIYELMQINF